MTRADARAAFAGILAAGGVPIGPPGTAVPVGCVFGDGLGDLAHLARGQVGGAFRVTLFAGAWDADASAGQLDTMIAAAVTAIRGAPGWRLDAVRADRIVQYAGGLQLAADVVASTMLDI